MEDDFQVLIDTYVNDGDLKLVSLRQALVDQDTTNLRALAHSLKGSSGNMGAEPLAAICCRVEEAALSQNLDQMDEDISAIESEFARVKQAIANI